MEKSESKFKLKKSQTSNFKCPRDGEFLKTATFEDKELHCCLKCKGVLVPQRSLSSLLEIMGKDLLETISVDYPIEKIPDKGSKVHCPKCSKIMENFGYMGNNLVMIDRCLKCNIIWMDTGELGIMCILHARTSKRVHEIREREQRNIKEQRGAFDAMYLFNATERSFMDTFFGIKQIATGKEEDLFETPSKAAFRQSIRNQEERELKEKLQQEFAAQKKGKPTEEESS